MMQTLLIIVCINYISGRQNMIHCQNGKKPLLLLLYKSKWKLIKRLKKRRRKQQEKVKGKDNMVNPS